MTTQKLWFKTLCAVLAFSLTFIDLIWAADVRQMLVDAKKSFDTWDDDKRLGGMPRQQMTAAEIANQNAVDSQNALLDLGKLNFSLSTQNGDIIRYVGNKIDTIQTTGGNLLNNITLDESGTILKAAMRLADGSIQLLDQGNTIAYRTPDGAYLEYQGGRIQKMIQSDGTETLYSYVFDGQTLLQTVLDSAASRAVYDASGRMMEVLLKNDGTKIYYASGILQKIVTGDGAQTAFVAARVGDDIVVTEGVTTVTGSGTFVDPEGNTYYFEGEDIVKIQLQDGSILRDVVWNGAGTAIYDASVLDPENNLYIYKAGVVTQIILSAGSVIKDITWRPDNAMGEATLVDSNSTEFYYRNGDIYQVKMPDGSVFHSIERKVDGTLRTGILEDAARNRFYYVEGVEEFSKIRLADGRVLRDIVWNQDGKIREARCAVPTGEEFYYADGAIINIKFADGSIVRDIVRTSDDAVQSAVLIDTEGVEFYYSGGSVSQMRLVNGQLFSDIRWDASGKMNDAALTTATGQKFVYRDKKIIQSIDLSGTQTRYSYVANSVFAKSSGKTYEYSASTGVAIGATDASGVRTTFFTDGPHQGLAQTDVTLAGTTYLYEYQDGPDGALAVQKSESVPVISKQIHASTSTSYSKQPVLKFDVFFDSGELGGQSVVATAYGSGRSLSVQVVPGDVATYTFGGVRQNLAFKPQFGKSYTVEMRWATGRVELYVYEAGTKRPESPQGIITNWKWNPTFQILSTRADVVRDPISSGKYMISGLMNTGNNSYSSGNPVEAVDFRFDTLNPADQIALYALQTQDNIRRNLTFTYFRGKWTLKKSDTNLRTGRSSNQSFTVFQKLGAGVDYTAEIRIENGKAGFYVYEKGSARPTAPLASLASFDAPTLFSASSQNTTVSGRILQNLSHPDVLGVRAPPLSTEFRSLQNMLISYKGLPLDPGGKVSALISQIPPTKELSELTSPKLSLKLALPRLGQKSALPYRQKTYSVAKRDLSILKKPAGSTQASTQDFDFTSITYDSESRVKEIIRRDGSRLSFVDGILKEVHDAAGELVSFRFEESALANIVGTTISSGGVSSTYGAEGGLTKISIGDMVIYYKSGHDQIDWIEKADGTELHELQFSPSGELMNVEVHDPEGNIRTYENGKLTRFVSKDQTIYRFLADRLFEMITPDKLIYAFEYTPEKIIARLDASITPDALTPVKMEYGQNMDLKRLIRKNEEILSFLGNDLLKIESPGKEAQVFEYQKDATGKITQTAVTQGGVIAEYDDASQLTQTTILPTPENPHTLIVGYRYGKIREIKKNGVLTLKYSYEYSPTGAETTLIEDLEEKSIKKYVNELLLEEKNIETSVLSEYSYESGRVLAVKVTRFGRPLTAYRYTYESDLTIVTDEEGVKRTYNKERKLSALEKNKEKYTYSYWKSPKGEEIVEERLTEKILSNGTKAIYQNDRLDRIILAGGMVLSDIQIESGALKRATATSASGVKQIFDLLGVLEEVDLNGNHLYYDRGRLERVESPVHGRLTYTYDEDATGKVKTTWIQKDGQTLLKYDPTSSLAGIKLPGVWTPEEVLKNTVHSYSGGSNGSYSNDGNFNTAQVGGLGQLLSEHIFTTPQTVTNFTYQMSANSYSSGKSNNGSEARTYLETKDATTGAWTMVPGTYLGQSHGNGGGGGSTAFANTASPAQKVVNLSNVSAVRAAAYAGAYANGGGNAGGSSAIWDIQFTLADQSFMNFNIQKDSTGKVKGYDFSGPKGVIAYDASGKLLNSPSSFQGTAKSLENLVASFVEAPFKNKIATAAPTEFGDWHGALQSLAFDSSLVIVQEYDASGSMEVQKKADGTYTLFEGNKPKRVLDEEGKVLIEYIYDGAGNIQTVHLKNARDVLPEEIKKSKLKIEEERQKSLLELARQKNLAYQSIFAQSKTHKDLLDIQLQDIQKQYDGISQMKVKGKQARNQKADALGEIQGGIDQVRDALGSVYKSEADAYAGLDAQVKTLSDQIEGSAGEAFTALAQQETLLKKEIIRQEISPVIYDHYRRILGRDPSSSEYDSWTSKIDYETGRVIVGENVEEIRLPGASLAFDGSGDSIRFDDSSDWDILGGASLDYTIDFWVKQNSLSGTQQYAMQYEDGNDRWTFSRLSDGRLYFAYEISDSNEITTGAQLYSDKPVITNTAWHHVALVRNGKTLRLFVDGVSVGSIVVSQSKAYAGRFYIGAFGGFTEFASAQFDEFRISQGVARWTNNFAPSTEPYKIDSATKLLLRASRDTSTIFDAAQGRAMTKLGDTRADLAQYKVEKRSQIRTPITQGLTEALTKHLEASPELAERTAYVAEIKGRIVNLLTDYLSKSDTERQAIALTYGLASDELIPLSTSDVQKILSWLTTRSLHFGQSAFLSLESLLDQKGIHYAREDLATRAILIDILTGVISPLDDGDLVISVYALNKVASLYGLSLSGANLTWEDLQAIYKDNPTARVIAHISGNHFVIITGMESDRITYIDPGIGKDKHNESLTIAKAGFLKVWKGNVASDTVILNAAKQRVASQVKILSAQETQSIRGAFWGSILNLIGFAITILSGGTLTPLAFALYSMGAAVSVIEGDWISAITSIVTLGLAPGGLGGFFKDVFQGVTSAMGSLGAAFNTIGGFIKNIYTGVTGFLGNISSGIGSFLQGALGVSSKVAANIASTAVSLGVSFSVSKGLETIGVNPQIAGFLGSLTAGAFIGATGKLPTTEVATNSGMQSILRMGRSDFFRQTVMGVLTLQNVGRLGLELGLDPSLTNIIGYSLAAIQGQLIDKTVSTLSAAFSNIKPQLFSSLSQYGIQKLGTSIGVDPRISGLIAAPISTAIGTGIQAGNPFGKEVIQSVQDSLFRGATSYGIGFATSGISSPFLESLTSRAIAGAIEGALFRQNIFSGLYETAQSSVLNLFGRNKQEMLSNTTDFVTLISQEGNLGSAFEKYATTIFDRETLESVWRSGGFTSALLSPKQNTTLPTGQIALKTVLSDGTAIFFNSQNQFIGLERQGIIQIGKFGITRDGSFGLQEGTIYRPIQNNFVYSGNIKDGEATELKITVDGKEVVRIQGPTNEGGIVYDQVGNILSGFIRMIKDGIQGLSYLFKQGVAYAADIPIQGSIQSVVSALKKNFYVLVNGLLNPNTDPTQPTDQIKNLQIDLVGQSQGKIQKEDTFPAPIYQPTAANVASNFAIDSLKWLFESQLLGQKRNVTNQIQWAMEKHFILNPQDATRPLVAMGYSGGFAPLAEVLSTKGYNATSIVGLAGASLSLTQDTLGFLLQLIHQAGNFVVDGLEALLKKLGTTTTFIAKMIDSVQKKLVNQTVQNILEAIDYAVNQVPFIPSNLPSLKGTRVQQVVNIWGTQDIFYKFNVAGKRTSLFDIDNTVNIEIIGAEHGDYMRRGPNDPDPEDDWNRKVSAFTTDLIIASDTADNLQKFFNLRVAENSSNGAKIATFDSNRGVWIIRVPGWEYYQ